MEEPSTHKALDVTRRRRIVERRFGRDCLVLAVVLERRRATLARWTWIQSRQPMTRDEVVEVLATKTTRFEGRVTSSHEPDAKLVDMVSGQKVDTVLREARYHERIDEAEAWEAVLQLKRIDRMRAILSPQLGAVIEALYIQEESRSALATRLGIDDAMLELLRKEALVELTERFGRGRISDHGEEF